MDLNFSLPNIAISDTPTAPTLAMNRRRDFQHTPAGLIFNLLNGAIRDLQPTPTAQTLDVNCRRDLQPIPTGLVFSQLNVAIGGCESSTS